MFSSCRKDEKIETCESSTNESSWSGHPYPFDLKAENTSWGVIEIIELSESKFLIYAGGDYPGSDQFAGMSEFYLTENSGESWVKVYDCFDCSFSHFRAVDENTCFATFHTFGWHSEVRKTSNSGHDWEMASGVPEYALIFDELNYAYKGFPNGQITNDGGNTWQDSPNMPNIPYTDLISVYSNTSAYVSNGSYLFHTSDQGLNWDSIAPYSYEEFAFINQNIGFSWEWDYSGQNPEQILWKTQDGGLSWQESFAMESIVNGAKLHFVNENIGFILAENNTVYKTNNGGQNWELDLDVCWDKQMGAIGGSENAMLIGGYVPNSSFKIDMPFYYRSTSF
mgnify:CR=1 FL=1